MEAGYQNNYVLHLDQFRFGLFGLRDSDRRLWQNETNDIIVLLKDEFQGCVSSSVPLGKGRYSDMERLQYGPIRIDIAHSVRDPFAEWYILNKGWIRITNEDKLDYRLHHEAIQRVQQVLTLYDNPSTWGTQYAEFCIDCTDPKKGREMLLRGYPRNWRGRRPEVGTTGLEQYFGTNNRGKRHHAYVKEGQIYRWEVKVGRDTLRSEGMDNYSQVMDKAPSLMDRCLYWLEPKSELSRHYARLPVGRAVDALMKKTTLGTGRVIDKYFDKQVFPVFQVVQ